MFKKQIRFEIHPETALNSAPHPVPMKKLVPDWYKNMESNVPTEHNPKKCPIYYNPETGGTDRNMTMKTCIPIRDIMTAGYALLTPCDIVATNHEILSGDPGIGFDWSDPEFHMFDQHSQKQVAGAAHLEAACSNGSIFKYNNPWRIKTPKGYSCYFRPPALHDLPWEVIPAIVDTDVYHSINFPFIWKDNTEPQIHIKKGTPIMQIIPFKREEWSMSVNGASKREEELHYRAFNSVGGHFYRDFMHKKKKWD